MKAFKSQKIIEKEKDIKHKEKLAKDLEEINRNKKQLNETAEDLKIKLFKLQQDSVSKEKILTECKKDAEESKNSLLDQKQRAEYDAHTEAKQSNDETQRLEEDHKNLTVKCEKGRLDMKKKLLELQQTHQKEMQYSRSKILSIIQKKEATLEEKRATLLRLKETIADKESELNERRKNQLLGLNPEED